MKTLRGLRISIRALLVRKLRATLAIASVAVGVAAVVVTGAIGEGAQEEVLHKIQDMGTNLLVVRPAQVRISAARKDIRGAVTTLSLDDCVAISQLAPVAEAVPGFESAVTLKAGNTAMPAMVLGTTAPYLDVARFRLKQGRFINDDDDSNARRVAVLGSRVNENLFNGDNAVGQEIRIRGIPFEVIGVLEAKGVLADGSDQDNRVMIPVRTALRRVFNTTWLNPVFVSVRDTREMDEARTEIARLLRDRHRLEQRAKPDDFSIQDKTKGLSAQKQVANMLTSLATGLAGVSLVVGGAGILALMLMSVKERTGEIGLRIAVGARAKDILTQFLLEAIFLTAGGWLVGISLGVLVAAIVGATTSWKIAVSPGLVLTTLGVMAATGLAFGAYPAHRASLLPPTRALRAE
jgi:putative ABC transport system permease protein